MSRFDVFEKMDEVDDFECVFQGTGNTQNDITA